MRWAGGIEARAADTRAMMAGFEQTLAGLARAERAVPQAAPDGDPNGAFAGGFEGDFEAEPGFANGAPRPLGAGVPEPPDDAAPPLNRRQRRAFARLRRKQKRGERVPLILSLPKEAPRKLPEKRSLAGAGALVPKGFLIGTLSLELAVSGGADQIR